MLLKRSVNLRNHWHLKERWRRNWNICIMFYCVFQGKGNCTITSLGHKPVFSWRRNSQKVCTGTSISMWICLSVTKTTTPDWEDLASDAPERQTAHETAWGIPLSWGWGCRSSLCLMRTIVRKDDRLALPIPSKVYFRTKTIKIFFNIFAEIWFWWKFLWYRGILRGTFIFPISRINFSKNNY